MPTEWIRAGERFGRIPEFVLRSMAWRGLTDAGRQTYIALALHADAGGWCNPSQTTLVAITGLKRRTIQKATQSLSRSGLVAVIPGRGNGNRSSYVLLPNPMLKSAQMYDESSSAEKAQSQDRMAHGQTPKGASAYAPEQTRKDQENKPLLTDQIAATPPGVLRHELYLDAGTDLPHDGRPLPTATQSFDKQLAISLSAPLKHHGTPARSHSISRNHAGEGKNIRTAPLNDEEKLRARSDSNAMYWYLTRGRAALRVPIAQMTDLPGLPMVRDAWHDPGTSHDLPRRDATHPQLATWAWWQVCVAREAAGEKIDLPQMGRLIGAIKSLSDGHTQDEVVAVINILIRRWAEIASVFDWWSRPPKLDESALIKSDFVTAAKDLIAGRPINISRKQHLRLTTKPPITTAQNTDLVAVGAEADRLNKQRFSFLSK